jgi:hypothetical protein
MEKKRKLTRKERKELTMRVVREQGPALKLLQIAEMQGLKKSPLMWGIVQELVQEGQLEYVWANDMNGQATLFFSEKGVQPCLL